MASTVNFTFIDRSGELSTVGMNFPTTTGANIAAQSASIVTGGALADAIAALSLCTFGSSALTAAKVDNSSAIPVSAYAQRELGLLVTYADAVTGKKYHVTIPGPDWATLGQSGTDVINPAAAAWTTFCTAFEAAAVSPDGNAVNVVSGRLVGRNR